jgi:hypothetical protein
MPFGYIGQNQTKQQVKNSGVLSSFDISLLEKQSQASGSLEFIAEQTADGTSATIDFTNIKEDVYNIHFLTYTNVGGTGADYDSMYMRLFEGGVLESANVYQYGNQRIRANGGTNEYRSTSSTSIFMHYGGVSNHANQKINAYAYFYNLGDVNKFSFVTNHGSCITSASEASIFSMVFGGTVLPQASVVDGIRIFNNQPTGASNISDGSNFKLYGIKEL